MLTDPEMFVSGEDLITGDAETASGAQSEGELMARALAALFAAGATLALLTIALGHSRRASELGLLVIVGIAYCMAAGLYWWARTLPHRVLDMALLLGSTLIAGVAYLSGQNPSPLSFFYLWVFLYASYFLTLRETAVQIVYAGLAYGALLVARPPSDGIAEWWLVGMGTLLVAAVLIGSMRARAESLIERLYDAARTDPLTKLSNRRGFREHLDLELERARRGNMQVSVVMGDVDQLSKSTIVLVATSVMRYCGASRAFWRRAGVSSTESPGSAARSSRCSCPTPTAAKRSSSPSGCALSLRRSSAST